jgi:hypothetical protein
MAPQTLSARGEKSRPIMCCCGRHAARACLNEGMLATGVVVLSVRMRRA